jgi:hypothetical protein
MKKIFIYAAVLMAAVSCNQKEAAKEGTTPDASTSGAPADIPYTMEKPYRDWQPGDANNAIIVTKMLKAWENKNLDECATYFADSIYMAFDNYRKKISHDSIHTFLISTQVDYASVKVELQDWESVHSGDNKEAWVSVWYKETWVDKKGVADSIDIIDDAQLVNGKITVLSEYTQKYPGAKKK